MFFWMVSMVLLPWEADIILGMGLEFKDKGIMHGFREGKCQRKCRFHYRSLILAI